MSTLKKETMVKSSSELESNPEELIFYEIFVSSYKLNVSEGNISFLRIHDQYLKEPHMASWVRKIHSIILFQ